MALAVGAPHMVNWLFVAYIGWILVEISPCRGFLRAQYLGMSAELASSCRFVG